MANRIDHFHRAARGTVALHIAAGDINGEELSTKAAGAEARKIGMAIRSGFADVETGDRAAGNVVMRIDEQGGTMHAAHLIV